MSRTGKWLLIFGLAAFIGAIAFGWSVAVYGVTNNDYSIQIAGNTFKVADNLGFGGFGMANAGIRFSHDNTVLSFDFEKQKEYPYNCSAQGVNDIRISLASCNAEVVCADTDMIDIKYTTGTRPMYFSADVSDGVLSIDEKVNFTIFGIGSWTSSKLILTLPETLYSTVDINLASGSINSAKLTSDTLKANVASGKLILGASADNIDINLASGKVQFTNVSDSTSGKISISTASGSLEMNGYKCSDTTVQLASGNVTLGGISGKVKTEIASGSVVLNYAEWDNDLDIQLLSGKCDVTLPEGSGANIDFSRLSGSMTADLDGKSVKLSGNSNTTIGGSNIHNIKGDVASGKIDIHN